MEWKTNVFRSLVRSLRRTARVHGFAVVSLLRVMVHNMVVCTFNVILVQYGQGLFNIGDAFGHVLIIVLNSLLTSTIIDTRRFLVNVTAILLLAMLGNVVGETSFRVPTVRSLVGKSRPVVLGSKRVR